MKSILPALLTLALVAPTLCSHAAEPKKVIVCTVTTGFRHSSIPFAEKALEKLASESKAFTVVEFVRQPDVQVPRKPNKPKDLAKDADDKAKQRYENDLKKYEAELAKWTPEVDKQAKDAQAKFDTAVKAALESLSPANLAAKKIDAVIFANTTGDLPLPDKEGFIKWIEDGHSFVGMHSASDTFHKFDGYLEMLGGEFNGHGAQVPADLVAGDTEHPANGGIGAKWNLAQEEMYRIKRQDSAKVRSLWFLQHDAQKVEEKMFFPVSWCKMAGKGRVFYTSLGHREDLWSDDPEMKDRKNSVEISKQYQAHILGGIKWALGLAEGSAVPNPAVQ
ncbi:MAG: ThuA domain-containing protein [Chthoniobacteraceae bacterium]